MRLIAMFAVLLMCAPLLAANRVLATRDDLATRLAALHEWLLATNSFVELQSAPTAQQIADFDAGIIKAMRWDTNNQKLIDALDGPVECADGIKTSCEFLGSEVSQNSWIAADPPFTARCEGLCANRVRITIVPVP